MMSGLIASEISLVSMAWLMQASRDIVNESVAPILPPVVRPRWATITSTPASAKAAAS